ncbi:MAG TPA: DUF4214 domain-containing protein [Pirellulales bacterium]|nr:DUF4214 domain-containing protein [Pirellulales bacterium]
MLEGREMMTVVTQGNPTLQATEGIVAEQPIIGLPQTLTGIAGVPLGQHSGVGFGEVIAGIRQDISAGPQSFVAAIDWGDGVVSNGYAFLDLTASDTQHRAYSVFAEHAYTQPGTYAITVVFSEQGVPEATVTSTATISGTDNQRFVDQVYRDLLGRQPDADGLTVWLARLDQGMPREQFVAQLEQSAEYRQDQVMAIFQKYLHRPADPAGLEMGGQLLAHGGADEQLAQIVVGSQEYFALHGGANDGFLAGLFQDALHRPIDAGAMAAFGQELAAGASRTQIAATVFSSGEYHGNVIDDLYLRLLHRHADSAGQSYWTHWLDAGNTDEQLIAALAASDEYFGRSA